MQHIMYYSEKYGQTIVIIKKIYNHNNSYGNNGSHNETHSLQNCILEPGRAGSEVKL